MEKVIISMLLLIWVATSCAPMSNKERAYENDLLSIEAASVSTNTLMDTSLIVDTLGEKQLLAFEKRAIQEAHDFIDYLRIISDQKYDRKLRKNTLGLALQLFKSDSCTIQQQSSGKMVLINDYLQQLYKGKVALEGFEVSDISLKKDFSLDIKSNLYRSSIALTNSNQPYTINLILTKNEKLIGENSFDVWEVKLGNIY